MKIVVFAIIPIILLLSVSTSVMINSSLLDTTEKVTQIYPYDEYEDYEDEENDILDIDGKQYSTVEDYISNNPIN